MKIDDFVFDAEQLSFKKLDDDNVTWVTIRGNHVPIPKHGSKEEKAKAIKEWFASKKKELPKSKGRVSFYSAKVEHEQPKKTARSTGEGAQVHGEGQYTLKYAKNNYENYFKKFGNTKSLSESMTPQEKRELRGWGSVIFGGRGSIEGTRKKMENEIKMAKSEIESFEKKKQGYSELWNMNEEDIKKLLDNPAEMKRLDVSETILNSGDFRRYINNMGNYYRDKIQQKKDYIEKTKEAQVGFEKYVNEGKIWEEANMFAVGEKIYKHDESGKHTENGMRYWQINKLYKQSPEERKATKQAEIERYKKQIAENEEFLKKINVTKSFEYTWWDKHNAEEAIRLDKRELSWWEKLDTDDIRAAKPQMAKVELPASKTYIRERTSLRGQSNYVKQAIKSTLVNTYQINELRSEYGLNDIADEFESIIDDAVGLNNNHSSAKHIEAMLEEVQKKIDTGARENLINGIRLGDPDYQKFHSPVEKMNKLNNAIYLVEKIAGRLKTTLLAKDYDKDELVIGNGASLYDKLGRYIANEKSKSYWGASERQGQLAATTALSKHGISGIAYTGHGVSRVSGYSDNEGNVTFDPSKIKVLERTTDPAVIEEWIKKQEKLGQKERK